MHSCPDCGQACYCHGDIDDFDSQTPRLGCDCCADVWAGDDEDDEDYSDGDTIYEDEPDDHGADCPCNACCDRRAGNAPQPEDA